MPASPGVVLDFDLGLLEPTHSTSEGVNRIRSPMPSTALNHIALVNAEVGDFRVLPGSR